LQVKCNDEGILQCTHVYACKRAHLYGPSAALPSCCNCKLKLAWYLVTSPEHTLQCAAWIARETPAHSCCSACCMHVSGILLSCAVHMYSLSRSKSSLLPHNVGSGAALTILQLTHTQLDSLAGLAALRGVQPVLLRRRCNERPRAGTAVPGAKYKPGLLHTDPLNPGISHH